MTIEDIEEITFPADSTEDVKSNRADSRFVTKRVLKSRFPSVPKNAHENDENAKSTAPISDDFHFLPDQHKIFVKTWGCSHNNSDSEYMAGLLVAHGYSLIMSDADRDSADLWLLNSCTVKNPSEQTFVNEIKRAQKQGIPVVLAGCVPQAQPNNDNWSRLSVIGVQQIDRVVEVVEETLKGNTVRLFSVRRELVKHDDDGDSDNESSTRKKKAGGASLDLPKIRKNPYVEIIPINTGCLNQCTYCKTKHARGDLGSYPPEEIVGRVKSVLNEGISEIWLTSEDTGAYGRDISKKLPDLLRQIVTVLEEAYSSEKKEVMLRVGMTNPPYILDDLEEIAEILNHDRVFKFLHIPVQSGSDRVLDDMRRQYTCKDFREVVEFLRKNVPGITIATDLICGFPTEQEEDHQDSYKLIDDFKFPVLHISQFYPRPGTPAARMQRLPTNIVKERSREITKLFESYTSYEPLMNTVQRVWITDEISKKAATDDSIPSGEDDYANTLNQNRYDDCWVAHDIYYHQVLIPKNQIREVMANSESWANQSSLLGFACDVRIFHAGKHYLGKSSAFCWYLYLHVF